MSLESDHNKVISTLNVHMIMDRSIANSSSLHNDNFNQNIEAPSMANAIDSSASATDNFILLKQFDSLDKGRQKRERSPNDCDPCAIVWIVDYFLSFHRHTLIIMSTSNGLHQFQLNAKVAVRIYDVSFSGRFPQGMQNASLPL